MSRFPLILCVLLGGCASGRAATAPAPAPSAPPVSPEPSTPPGPQGAAPGGPAAQGPRPYDRVITRGAVSDSGLFLTHRVEARHYFEIPDSLLGRDLLLITRIAQAPEDLSPFLNAGTSVAEQVVRWERQGNRLLLRSINFRYVAADTLPIARSVRINTFAPIIRTFRLEARNRDSTASVIDVTPLFEEDIPALSGLSNALRTQFRFRRYDQSRSFIDRIRSFPLNVEVRHTQTFDVAEPPSQRNTATLSMQMSQSLVLLPREPMRPRYADPRVGWFTVSQINFGLPEQKAAEQSFIQRWRLEPKDPAAYARGELVEPVKPIVYYIDPATPAEWRRWIKQGVEDWQAAFETAGFRNAILARDPPTPAEDPDFDPDDVRYSTVRYVANLTRNAVGPSVADPRTGEIIESDIIWYHNHLRSYRNRLMVETGAANPAARSLRMPEELIGETVRQVIAHEIGHALGLPHNMGGSSSLPTDSLRSPSYTDRMGVSPSIMDYARQNYVAQPGDGVRRFVRKIGPYDHYAINWGYRVLPEARTPEAEKPVLDRWIRERADDPMYRFAGGLPWDPSQQTEDIGDDPVKSSRLGIANLQRVVPHLPAWTATPGEGYDDLQELHGELVASWNRYVNHVVTLVGGVYQRTRASDQPGPVFDPVPAARQREAIRFLTEQVFTPPTWLVPAEISSRIEHAGAVERVRQAQAGTLNRLLDPQRMQRMVEAEARLGGGAYPLAEMLADVRRAIWSELPGSGPIDLWRRNLQRAHLARLESLMTTDVTVNPTPRGFTTPVTLSQSDVRALVRSQLVELRAAVRARSARTAEAVTRAHLEDVAARITAVLEPR